MKFKIVESIKRKIFSENNLNTLEEVDLFSLIENTTYDFLDVLKGKNLKLVYDIAENVPQFVIIDEEKFKHTLGETLKTVINTGIFNELILEIKSKNDKLLCSIYDYKYDVDKKSLNQIVEGMDRENYKYLPYIKKLFNEKYTVQFHVKYKEIRKSHLKFYENMDIVFVGENSFVTLYLRKFLVELGADCHELSGIFDLNSFISSIEKVSKCSYIIISDEYFNELNWDIFRLIKEDYILREKVIILNLDLAKLKSIKSFKLNYIEANPLSKYNILNNILLYHEKLNNNLEERKNKIILIVEDNKVNAEVFTEYLKLCNLHGEVAFTGEEALQKLSEGHYDMVFTDIQLPDIDGFEIARQIRSRNKFIPIIAVTVQLYSGYEEDYSKAGIDEYIAKPVIFEELQKLLFKYLNLTTVDFDSVRNEYGDKIFQILIKNHLKFIDQYMDEFKKTLEDENVNEIKRSAHKLKGSISNFKMSKILRLLNEVLYSELEIDEILKLGNVIVKEIENLNKELREYTIEMQIDLD